jgi:hypothetical protein
MHERKKMHVEVLGWELGQCDNFMNTSQTSHLQNLYNASG